MQRPSASSNDNIKAGSSIFRRKIFFIEYYTRRRKHLAWIEISISKFTMDGEKYRFQANVLLQFSTFYQCRSNGQRCKTWTNRRKKEKCVNNIIYSNFAQMFPTLLEIYVVGGWIESIYRNFLYFSSYRYTVARKRIVAMEDMKKISPADFSPDFLISRVFHPA